jgi:RNA polymerase sigma factor (sigma-70 family)
MEEHDWLAERFEENRTRLRAVAYRMLGSLSEADDAVQESWLRLSRSDTSGVENLGRWLTTVVGRVCLDMRRSRRLRREEPLEAHVPDPIVSRADETDPEHQALLADSVGLALLVVLQTVAPAERLAFVLHDMFAMPFDEIAPIVGRSPALTFARLSPFVRPALVNGVAGVVVAPGGRPFSVMAFTVRDGRIVEIDALADPARLRELDLAVLDD